MEGEKEMNPEWDGHGEPGCVEATCHINHRSLKRCGGRRRNGIQIITYIVDTHLHG